MYIYLYFICFSQLAIDNGLRERNFTQISHYKIAPPYVGGVDNQGASAAMAKIKAEGFRTILLLVEDDPEAITAVADAVEEFQCNTPDEYVWMMAGNLDLNTLLLDMAPFNANITKLLQGAASLRALDGFDYNPTAFSRADPFLEAWKALDNNTTMVHRLRQLVQPLRYIPEDEQDVFQAPSSYFATEMPQEGAAFMYDAVIAQGLGRCKYVYDQLLKKNESQVSQGINSSVNGEVDDDTQRDTSTTPPPSTEDIHNNNLRRLRPRGLKGARRNLQTSEPAEAQHPPAVKKKKGPPLSDKMKAIYDSADFEGATGRVAFGERKFVGSRKRETVTYGVFNVRAMEPAEEVLVLENNDNTNPEASSSHPWYYLTDVLQGGPVDGTWYPTPFAHFRFASGSSTAPLLLRDVPNQNFLDASVQRVGWTFFGLIVAYVVTSMVFVAAFRNASAVRQGQPIFLLLILIGCLMLSMGMLTLSFDEDDGISTVGLSAMCLSTLWLLVLGYILIYAALFCKLYRINKVLSFARRTVNVRHVIGPLVGLMVLAVIVLLLWSALDPFVWVRKEINAFTGESYGQCASNNSLPYLLAVIGLMMITTIASAIMAWVTKDVDERFSESKWIFYTIFVKIQLMMLGIPVLIILGTESAEATYLGRALLIFLIVATTVTFMVGPKALRVYQNICEKKSRQRSASPVASRSMKCSKEDIPAFDSIRISGHDNSHASPATSTTPLEQASSSAITTSISGSGDNHSKALATLRQSSTTSLRRSSVKPRGSIGGEVAISGLNLGAIMGEEKPECILEQVF